MKSFKTIISAGFLASALALAGCGGGSDDDMDGTDTATTMPDPPPEDMRLETAVDAAGRADAARTEAEKLSMMATDASEKVSAKKVNGSSMRAYNNTMTVLGARLKIEAQQELAMDAVDRFKDIDDSDMSEDEKARIARLLRHAEGDLKAIDDLLAKGAALETAENAIKGTSSDTPTEIAMANRDTVAEAIADALQRTGLNPDDSTNTFAAWTSVAHADVPDHGAIPDDDDPVMRAGKSGKTFAQISESEAPMAAKKLGDFMTTDDPPVAVTSVTAGTPLAATYKGIPGSLICGLATGACDADGGTAYFVPTNAFHLYKSDGDDGYVQQKNAAHYGYWLDDNAAIRHHASSDSIGDDGTTNILDWTDGDTTATKTATATYQGEAGGFSERTVGEGDDATQMSGEFTADVNLKATFSDAGTNDTLQGTISGFAAKAGSSGSGHVNSAWVIGLARHSAEFAANGVLTNASPGTFSTEYRNGEEGATGGNWTATAYGDNEKHPTGFVGAFNAAFEDGSAAGVYQAD